MSCMKVLWTQVKPSEGGKSNGRPPPVLEAPWSTGAGWLRSSRLGLHPMGPPRPGSVPRRLTLRLPSSPRAPAAMAGPRGRIDLSTPPCQQPLGHNLTWRRAGPHPRGSSGWPTRRRVHVCAAKTLRGEGDKLQEEWIRPKTGKTGLAKL